MDLSGIDIVVLCGGLGTRLQPSLGPVPKPMVRIGGRPFLGILVEYLRDCGFKRVLLATGYGGDFIKQYFERFSGVTILFSQEEKPLGTGGALKRCERLLGSGMFMALNGDTFCPALDLSSLLDFHRRSGGVATVALVPAQDRQDGGFVTIDGKDRVLSFCEKKPKPGGHLNAGVYAFQREALACIPEDKFYSLEEEFLCKLPPQVFYGYTTAGELYDIGTPERLRRFRRFWLGNLRPHGSKA